jgi:dTDP-4-dehydrorhamnose 3,5-epimerase
MCAIADVRPASATFGRALTFLLGDEPGERIRLFACEGLANAFAAITECDYINDVSREFVPGSTHGIAWNDPTLAVRWPSQAPSLSDADASLGTLRELFPSHPLFA